jgi:transcriptional regulator with XRE-family HTH domain
MTFRTPQEAAQLLVAAGHSQAAIADRAGVKQPTISRILSGEHKDPKSSVLIKLNEFADQVAAEAAQAAAAQSEPQPQ